MAPCSKSDQSLRARRVLEILRFEGGFTNTTKPATRAKLALAVVVGACRQAPHEGLEAFASQYLGPAAAAPAVSGSYASADWHGLPMLTITKRCDRLIGTKSVGVDWSRVVRRITTYADTGKVIEDNCRIAEYGPNEVYRMLPQEVDTTTVFFLTPDPEATSAAASQMSHKINTQNKNARLSSGSHIAATEPSDKRSRIVVEFCCSPDSLLGESRPWSDDARVVRITEEVDVRAKPTEELIARELKAGGSSALLWASIPCTGGSQ